MRKSVSKRAFGRLELLRCSNMLWTISDCKELQTMNRYLLDIHANLKWMCSILNKIAFGFMVTAVFTMTLTLMYILEHI